MTSVASGLCASFSPIRSDTGPIESVISSGPEKKSPPRVLVVDDEALIRWSVTESLAVLGLFVQQAADAATALLSVRTATTPFDVVVLDLRLPDTTDLSLLVALRQLLPAARLVVMTAFATPEITAEATQLGATVLTKPFELDELSRIVMSPTTRCPSLSL